MRVFELAYLQLEREGLAESTNLIALLIDRAITIRNYLTKGRDK